MNVQTFDKATVRAITAQMKEALNAAGIDGGVNEILTIKKLILLTAY